MGFYYTCVYHKYANMVPLNLNDYFNLFVPNKIT
jgi:hypothetical protein